MSLRRKHSQETAEVDTGPLSDILFILLFYFIIMSLVANPYVVKLTNPKAKTDTKAKQSLIVSVKNDGSAYIGHDRVLFDSLTSELSKRIDKKDTLNKQGVVINADTSVSINKIVQIMSAAKRAGAASASLNVRPE